MGRFAGTLARLRREAGFPTAYAFYHKNGGKRTFPFTYPYYAKLERGDSLPRGAWLGLLLDQMRVGPTAGERRGLVLDYLRDLFSDDQAFDALVEPLLAAPAPEPGQRAVMKRLLSAQAFHVTPAQMTAVVASEESYWAFNCLVNNRKPLAAADIAAAAALPEARVTAALRTLQAVKLARPAGQRWSSPASGFWCVYPRGHRGYASDLNRLQRHIAAAAKRRGAGLMDMGTLVRAEESSVQETLRAVREAIQSLSAAAVDAPGRGTAFFVVEAKASRLFPF